MAIFLDSADPQHAAAAFPLGFLAGVTTNPALLAAQGPDPLETIRRVAQHSSGLIFYQPLAESVVAMEEEVRRVHGFLGERLVAKIACSPTGFELVACLVDDMPCGMTAVFSAAQVYAAACAGVRYALPYLNRMTRLGGDGTAVVERMAQVAAATDLELVVASIRSVEEMERALLAGADHVTVPFAVFQELIDHPLSRQAIAEFAAAVLSSSKGPKGGR
jgi:transaldolase